MYNKTVLIVDDSDSDAILTTMAFKNYGHECNLLRLKDGQELIEFLTCTNNFASRNPQENNRIYLILLDINMPRMSGIEALQTIKTNNDFKNLPVVMLSTSNSDSDLSKSYQIGANSYVEKMFDFEKHLLTISKIADYWLNINKRVMMYPKIGTGS